VGDGSDYGYSGDTIGSESIPYKDENDKNAPKKDTSGKKNSLKSGDKPIGSANEEKKERKGGLLKNLFKKREKN